jgi:hypothetical protein
MQIKTTLRFHLSPVRIAIIKNTTNNRCWWGCGEKRTLVPCWWECKTRELEGWFPFQTFQVSLN